MKIHNFTDFMKYVGNSKPMKYLTNPKGATAAAVTIATISNITKDGVNCAYYVTQSLNNERIPDRKFVAALDLSNGILNVVLQAVMGALFGIGADKLFEKKIIPAYFSESAIKKQFNNLTDKSIKFDDFVKIMEKNKGLAKSGLSVISALVGMQIITKRIIVPFIATPLASLFKKGFEKKEQQEAENNKQVAVA